MQKYIAQMLKEVDSNLNNDLKLCFVTAASPTDGFFSQVGMFRLSLNSLGGIYKDADIILSLGGNEIGDIPDRWASYFGDGIKLYWADPIQFQKIGIRAQGDNKWRYNYKDYDLVVFFDADTMLIKPLDELLFATKEENTVTGVIAHYPFPCGKDENPSDLWHFLAKEFTGKDIQLNYSYSLLQNYAKKSPLKLDRDVLRMWRQLPSKVQSWFSRVIDTNSKNTNCPFYLNFGFVAMTPEVLMTIRESYLDIRSKIIPFLTMPIYSGQIALTLAIHKHDVPTCSAGIKYNFPNDPLAEKLYPDQLKEISVIHYLRTQKFDRQKIFTTEEAFNEFLFLELEGSNKVFQNYIRNLTKGKYPFPDIRLPEKTREIE